MEMQEQIWNIVPMSLVFVIILVIMIAETNRSPFDLAKGESELVCGYCVEYGGSMYTLVFLAENAALLWSAHMNSVMFMAGSFSSVLGVVFVYIWLRSSSEQKTTQMNKKTKILTGWMTWMPSFQSGRMQVSTARSNNLFSLKNRMIVSFGESDFSVFQSA